METNEQRYLWAEPLFHRAVQELERSISSDFVDGHPRLRAPGHELSLPAAGIFGVPPALKRGQRSGVRDRFLMGAAAPQPKRSASIRILSVQLMYS
jgi:hypothetical protein